MVLNVLESILKDTRGASGIPKLWHAIIAGVCVIKLYQFFKLQEVKIIHHLHCLTIISKIIVLLSA